MQNIPPLPPDFLATMRHTMGCELFDRYVQSFDDDVPVSIRLNPAKAFVGEWTVPSAEPVAWCQYGYYLNGRPAFTMDPLLHAGCYYVQEASSMFLDTVLRSRLSSLAADNAPQACLDMCAAPGGKSTLMAAVLPEATLLVSNDPVRQRAAVLSENVRKWGRRRHVVTNNYPADFVRSGMLFDIILCDVPCSGEGMFRKDPLTRREWSESAVACCSRQQRDIADDAWQCLKTGGMMVYSTCTLNVHENEENVRWFLETHADASALCIATKEEWAITGSLLPDFHEPVYRFVPGVSRGEGLFMCVFLKSGSHGCSQKTLRTAGLHVVSDNAADERPSGVPAVDVGYRQAISYLRRESVVLSEDAPRGLVELTFCGVPLGMAKNIGQRANNLYPKEWKIRTTYVADTYQPVIVRR